MTSQPSIQRLTSVPPSLEPFSQATDSEVSAAIKDPRTKGSLYFCVVVTNPYFELFEEKKSLKVGDLMDVLKYHKHSHDKEDEEEIDEFGFRDEYYLDTDHSTKAKLVNMIRRFNAKKVQMMPAKLHSVQSEAELDALRNELFTSPDGDQIYILIRMELDDQKAFAQEQGIKLRTNPYSDLGGAAAAFSVDLDKDLARSVIRYNAKYGGVEMRYLKGQGADKGKGMGSGTDQYESWGYYIDIPQRVRLLERFIKTPWEFGGCGLMMDEMKRNGMLVENFFLLHSMDYAERHKLPGWASFRSILSLSALSQPHVGIRKYFGEKVALYFLWLETYTKFLWYPVLPGLAMTSYSMIANKPYNNPLMCIFAGCLLLWSVAWIRHWDHVEARFAKESGSAAESEQEMCRDEFVGEEEKVEDDKIHKMLFQYPLTLYRRPSGELCERKDTPVRRRLMKIFVTYPITLALVGGLVVVLIEITNWRFTHEDSPAWYASLATFIVMKVFAALFDKISEWLNDLENNRTDTEYENSLILKSFLFFFCNAYSALFIILFYPQDATVSYSDRLDQLSSQMTTILLVMPAVQNIIEVVLPIFGTKMRVRSDLLGSSWKALCSIVCGCGREIQGENAQEADFRRSLWKECQMEPFTAITGDYLEIAIQYGYMTMFACTFPWAPAAAFIYNVIEVRIDAYKFLYHTQRPRHVPAKSIGSWKFIFRFLVAVSIMTNGYITCFMSDTFQDISLVADDVTGRTRAFVVVQYIFLLVVIAALVLIPVVPIDVLKENAKEDILQQRSNVERTRLKQKAAKGGMKTPREGVPELLTPRTFEGRNQGE